jgi:hypothetical protein
LTISSRHLYLFPPLFIPSAGDISGDAKNFKGGGSPHFIDRFECLWELFRIQGIGRDLRGGHSRIFDTDSRDF